MEKSMNPPEKPFGLFSQIFGNSSNQIQGKVVMMQWSVHFLNNPLLTINPAPSKSFRHI
jgi:hypothetical protein